MCGKTILNTDYNLTPIINIIYNFIPTVIVSLITRLIIATIIISWHAILSRLFEMDNYYSSLTMIKF